MKSVFLQFKEKDVVRDCVEGFTEVQTDHIHSSSLVHPSSRVVIESLYVHQAALVLGEDMLAVSNHLPVRCIAKGSVKYLPIFRELSPWWAFIF